MNPAYNDGCTLWFDGTWRHCCDDHDLAYASDAVTWWSHIELGICVAQTSGGIFMGFLMALATLIWWLVIHSWRKRRD